MTSPNTNDALLDALCNDCGGLLVLPDAPVPAGLLRWCICGLEDLVAEQTKETIGFRQQAAKAKKRKE